MWPLSLRTRIVVLVLGVGLAPLAGLGLWMSGRTARTGEAVLRERLREALADQGATIQREFVPFRSQLLDLADLPSVRSVLTADALTPEPPAPLTAAFLASDLSLASVRIRGRSGEWLLVRGRRAPSAFGLPLHVRLPLYEPLSGDSLGEMEAAIHITALRPQSTGPMAAAIITALDPTTGAVLLPTAMDPAALGEDRLQWNGEPWVVERLESSEPHVRLVAAAPLAPFAAPYQQAGRQGLAILAAVLAIGLILAWLLSRRITSSLQQLADGAAAVAGGDLSRRVPTSSGDEVARVSVAFNTMTDNLRRTLDQLAERESLAAVNEFAAALAHEVRNPLTAIQLDLQEVEEQLPRDSPLRPLQEQALRDLRKLDRTVAAALDTARSGRVVPREVDLHDILAAAARAAHPAFDSHDTSLRLPEDEPHCILLADPDALERVFLNLLLNAAEAAGAGGTVEVDVTAEPGTIAITILDDGPGIPADRLDRVFEPFFTTRPGGTGVGLAVARRIVTAHRGTLSAFTRPGEGAGFTVTLPAAPGRA